MATQWYEYDDDAGTAYGTTLSDAQQAMYATVFGSIPTGYATFAALQAAVPAMFVMPPGLATRYLAITSPFFGTAQLVVLDSATFDAHYPTGLTPFPETPYAYTDSPAITGATGEARNSN